MPEVSVILPTNRDDGYLNFAVDSILNQQSIDLELIIVANNCTDKLWQQIQSMTDPRIRCYRTVIPQLSFNINFGIDQARSEFIARMDADDICYPQRLNAQFKFLTQNPDIDVVGCNVNTINEKGTLIGPRQFPENHEQIVKSMKFFNCICHPSTMFRKSKILSLGGYLGGFSSEDYELWLRGIGSKSLRFANLQDTLFNYRLHEKSAQGNPRSYNETIGHFAKLLFQYKNTYFFIGLMAAVFKRIIKPNKP